MNDLISALPNPVLRTFLRIRVREGAHIRLVALIVLIALCVAWCVQRSMAVGPLQAADLWRGALVAGLYGEIAALLIGGLSPAAKALGDDERSGLLDQNRMTPRSPAALLVGYLVGAAATGIAAALIVAAGLLVVAAAVGGVADWLRAQVLVAATYGLVSVAAALPRTGGLGTGGAVFSAWFAVPLFAGVGSMLGPWCAATYVLPLGLALPAWGDGAEGGTAFVTARTAVALQLQALLAIPLGSAALRRMRSAAGNVLSAGEAAALFLIVAAAQAVLAADVLPVPEGSNIVYGTHVIWVTWGTLAVLGTVLSAGVARDPLVVLRDSGAAPSVPRLLLGGPAVGVLSAAAAAAVLGVAAYGNGALDRFAPVAVFWQHVLWFTTLPLIDETARLISPGREGAVRGAALTVLVLVPALAGSLFEASPLVAFSLPSPMLAQVYALAEGRETDIETGAASFVHGAMWFSTVVVWLRAWQSRPSPAALAR